MRNKQRLMVITTIVICYLFAIMMFANGEPVGTTILFNETSTRSSTPDSRQDDGGTINTINVDATQQNFAWKAYVGNISGTLVLSDANNESIYEWSLSTLSGEIYATRSNSVSWSSVSCAPETLLQTEQTYLNMTGADVDSINNTFTSTTHSAFVVAGTTLNSCFNVKTYVNSSAQADLATSIFQEIVINDTNQNVIFAANLETNARGYNNVSTYDFQMIVPDNDISGNITEYYFYVELDG